MNRPERTIPSPPPLAGLGRYKRRVIQLLAALLFNLNLPGFATGNIYKGAGKAVCAPGLNCYSCPGALASCPIGALQVALANGGQKLPLYIIGTILAFGAIFGRTICGWLCPFGLIQELLDKVPLPKLHKGTWSRALSRGKYLILAGLVIILPVALASPVFCAWLCPAGTLEAGLPIIAVNAGIRANLGWQFVWKVLLLSAFIIACLFIYRPFCRFICPLGALYSFFNRFALLRYQVNEQLCSHCGNCTAKCKMDVRHVSDTECIQCGCCRRQCQANAISFTLEGLFTKPGQQRSKAERTAEMRKTKPKEMLKLMAHLALAIMLVLGLTGCSLLSGANNLSAEDESAGLSSVADASSEDSDSGSQQLQSGQEVQAGYIAPDFDYRDIDGRQGTLSKHQGQVVLINLWASWCPPCVGEMPEIDELKAAYPELVVLAVNISDNEEDALAYIEENGFSFTWIIDSDYAISDLYPSDYIPYTIIIDKDGVISDVFTGSPSDPYKAYEIAVKEAGY